MSFNIRLIIFILLMSSSLYGANVNVTTFYGKTGGVVGVLNTTSQVVNGRTICPVNPTVGCDFGDDPLFSNNGTTNDPSDDSYSGDLIVRTNDSFQITAGWLWNGEAGGSKEKVVLTGTLPSTGVLPDGSIGETKSYKWDTLPGSCDADESSISADKQTMTCVRKDFDKNDVGTYSEDLPFNVVVKGETLSRTQPGDVSFEISAEDAMTVSDDTDGYSLEVTAAPRWNLQKSMYTYYANRDVDGVRGWIMDYKFYIEVDEVNGETDNASALVGNESMGKDATFTFKDDLSEVSPNAKLIGCSFKGRYGTQDGYVGSADPITYSGIGSHSRINTYPERAILQTADEREITCTQSGAIIDVTAKHIDATLTNYPKLDYAGNALPVNRGIAAIGSIYVFIPLDDVKPKNQGGNNEGESADNSETDGWLRTKNKLTHFDPVTPTGNANFGGERESEKDNQYSSTLYYNRGTWDKYYRGTQNSQTYAGAGHISYYIGSGYRSGDGMVNANTEFSTWMVSNNRGGIPKTEDIHCDVFDGYRLEVQPIKDNTNYEVIKTQYYGNTDWPYRFYIGGGSGSYVSSHTQIPYDVEYANTYVDDSFLPSRGGDTSADVGDTIVTECTDPDVKWYSSLEDARSGTDGGLETVTKIRYTLKAGIEMPPGAYVYLITNHKVRSHDLKTGLPLENGDLIVDYATHRFNGQNWHKPSYKPGTYPGTHSGTAGDRVIFTGAKARVIKDVDKVALSVGDVATFNLKISYTNDTGLEEYSNVTVTDLLPKGLTYVAQSVSEPYAEPVMGTCADVLDLNSTNTPCVEGENQVLIWDLGERQAGEVFPDINYSTIVGVEVNEGTIRNIAKIEAPSDSSQISQRKSDVGMSVTIPASINIVKSTIENIDYPSLRERTTTAKEIDFMMNMRNGKAGDITDLDVIDILPFQGDADDGAIQFNNLSLKRKVATNYHGTLAFKTAALIAHPLSSSVCDLTANGGVKYYYTNQDPKTINIAPNVGDANVIGGANTIWCEGDENGPSGCNGLDNASVTAVRARGPRMEAQAICQFKVSLSVKDNLAGDNYSNSAGASATGITLPVLSNSLAVPIVGSSLGDYVWYDKNSNGIQDNDESGIAGVTVKLLTSSGTPVKDPSNPNDDYVVTTDSEGKYLFVKLISGNYVVEFVKPSGYLISDAGNGTTGTDTNIVDKINSRTGVIALGVDERDIDVDAGFYTPIISGNVFNDGNNDGTVNGSVINTADGSQLYVTLLDSGNTVLSSKAVAVDGTYSFDGEDNITADSNYTIILATSSEALVGSLPINWNNADGEHIGTGSGLDSSADGKISVAVTQSDVEHVNFGINKQPVASDVSEPIQFNPGGSVQVDVPDINVSDNEDGTPTTITIVSWTNNGQPYYNGIAVTVGQVIPNFDNTLLTLDPNAGTETVSIVYNTTDRVGVVSEDATITMPFKDLKIFGNLFIDGNGNGKIDGIATSTSDGSQLYVTLVNGGTAVASMPLSGGGTYEFDIEDGISANTSYTVILSETNGSVTASLPTEWSNEDGEQIGLTGTDGNNDGQLAVNVVTSDIVNANFGINKKPVAQDANEPLQTNPGNDSTVAVPDLNISDEQTTSGLTVTILTVPNNAILYYNGNPIDANETIANFDNSLLTVDPEAGDQNVSFNYTTTDGAGTESDSATVTLAFSNIIISGTLFNDGNGNGNVDGNETNSADGTLLYVTLLDASDVKVASKALEDNGTYYFDSVDGLAPEANYTIVLTKFLDRLRPSLPTDWNNADGENIGLVGLDGNADGINVVELLRESIPEINFGINKKPVAENTTQTVQFNPGGLTQVLVPDLNISDYEDEIPTTVTITQLPSNGTLYYEGAVVVVNTVIEDVNLSGFSIDPNDGDVTTLFNYTTTDRAGVVSEEATVTLPFTGLEISGHVFNDGNNDGTVNGTGIVAPNGVQLFVTLIDENSTVVASHAVNVDGTYLFGGTDGLIANSDYKVILSTSENNTTANLPADWNNEDGEHIGTNAGTDGSNDGLIEVSVLTSNIEEVNFGINKQPVANDVTEPLQLNPGAGHQVNVPDLVVSDNEDSVPSSVTIVSLPVNGTLYYNGTAVTAGQTFNDFNNTLLTVDPDNGDLSISFTYTTTDAVGVESEAATVNMSFDGLEIRGNVFNDGNNDGTVNGTKISQIEATTLHATLLDESGSVMATMPIKADGSYMFTGLDGIIPNSNYEVIVSIEANATTSTLLSNWNSADGEHVGVGVGLDAKADGRVLVNVLEVDVSEVNFGLNKKPVAEDKTEVLQINPGVDKQVAVPTLEISDNEDTIPLIITITTLPTNAILYYEGTEVTLDANLTDANLSKFSVNPIDGDVTVAFNYTTTDSVGVVSEPATVTMPFVGLEISGNIFNDGDNDGTVNGIGISAPNGVQLFVTLIDANGSIRASHEVQSDGSYLFSGVDGIISNSSYSVVLSTSENNTTAGLPTNWNNEDGEHIGTNAGTDGNNDGLIEVSVVTTNVEEVNFGINKKPVANDVTEPLQLNPGRDTQVSVADLAVSDNEDTTPSQVSILSLPVNGTLYYNGTAVTVGQTFNDFNNTLLTIDPDNGDLSISFTYTTTDAVGVESEEATVNMSFDGLEIRGNVFNDGNNDGTVNGTKISQIETTTLHATLLDESGSVMATMPIKADGSYTFTGLDGIIPNSNYEVIVSIEPNATSSTLLSNWNSADGEHVGAGVGLDANADGRVLVNVLEVDVPEVNFGLNEQPVAEDVVEVLQINPGGNKHVEVPTLSVTDNEDTIPTTITVTSLPSNAVLYYDGSVVTLNTPLTNFDKSKFTVNPNDGDVTVVFNYTTTDKVGVVSVAAKVTMPFVGLEIAGNIFNDGDNDGTVNGIGISAPNGVQLFVTLVDANGSIRASHEVNADGSYLFSGIDGIISNSDYQVVLSTSKSSQTASLPTGWNNEDGEHIGTDAGTDGSNDGMINVSVLTSNIEEVNFGINKQPVASDVTEALQLNPGNEIQVNVPDLVVSDNEDNTPNRVTIVTIPVNGTLYYNGTVVTAGQEISDFNNTLLTIDPNDGDLSISFSYTTTDAVNVVSEFATVSMSFDGLEIRGNVFNDGNNDGTVNGTKISQIEATTLHATLLDESGSVMATMPIKADGSYKFTGLDGIIPNSNYQVIVSIEANATTSKLLSNWNSADGEHVGAGVGLDAKADGRVLVNVLEVDVPEVNFGLNEQPVAEDKTEVLQINPGADKQVAVPTLEISDNEDKTPSILTITTLPTNATLYYEGVRVTVNMNISNVNLSQFTVDPNDGEVTVVFNYTTTDSVGVVSEPATVTMAFYGVTVSGQVYQDTKKDGEVSGSLLDSIHNLELYVSIVDANETVIATVAVENNGTYHFDASVGLIPDEPYTVRLSQEANVTSVELPKEWMHIDTTGIEEFTITSHDITGLDFGINKQPVVNNVVVPVRINPDMNATVPVGDLNLSMNEDGVTTPTTVSITELPNNGTLYYEGTVVTEGQVINDFNTTLLMVDPEDGNVTVQFSYTSTDEGGFESEPAVVKIPFDDIDTDKDGVPNNIDLDDDNDGILDTVENNTSRHNGDTDQDGIPDRLDLDSDNDGILDLEESNQNPETVDKDANGILDSTTDSDKDGVMETADADDNNPKSEGTVVPIDTDKDGQPDFQDVDADNDGLSDLVEGGTEATLDNNTDGRIDDTTDTDSDGIVDLVDSDNGGVPATTPDTDEDGSDNYRDLDSDGDMLLDVIEIAGVDSNNDGQIEPSGTLISGVGLPDENTNGIPDVLEIKLKDDERVAVPGETVTMDLLENDSGDIDKSSVQLLIPKDFNGTARLSPDGKRLVVDGEGEWSVDENGLLTFVPEEGFRGSPTSIAYSATTPNDDLIAIAGVSIKVTDVAGATTDEEVCDPYEETVSVYSELSILLILLLSSFIGWRLVVRNQ